LKSPVHNFQKKIEIVLEELKDFKKLMQENKTKKFKEKFNPQYCDEIHNS